MPTQTGRLDKMLQAGVAAWLFPGGGHYLLGHRGIGLVLCIAISGAYFAGLMFGGLKDSINPLSNKWLFMAELGVGGYTTVGYVVNMTVGDVRPSDLAPAAAPTQAQPQPDNPRARIAPALYAKYVSFYPAFDVGQIYLATAGLLNILAVLDALTRAQTGGLPTYHRHLAEPRAGGPA